MVHATGISAGLRYEGNRKVVLIARERLEMKFGAGKVTFSGLAGIGYLVIDTIT